MTSKKLSAAMLFSLLLCSNVAHAQFDLGKIVKGVVNTATQTATQQGAKGNDLLSGLTSVFSADKVATVEDLEGTWLYEEPAVVLKSSNVLKNVGGKVASATIEKKLKKQFEKIGISKGLMSMAFTKDGNFIQSLKKKSLKGTFSIEGNNVILNYAGQVKQMVGTTQVEGGDLLIVMDVSKLLGLIKTVGSLSGNSSLQTATGLLGSMDGMQCGFRLKKQAQ